MNDTTLRKNDAMNESKIILVLEYKAVVNYQMRLSYELLLVCLVMVHIRAMRVSLAVGLTFLMLSNFICRIHFDSKL